MKTDNCGLHFFFIYEFNLFDKTDNEQVFFKYIFLYFESVRIIVKFTFYFLSALYHTRLLFLIKLSFCYIYFSYKQIKMYTDCNILYRYIYTGLILRNIIDYYFVVMEYKLTKDTTIISIYLNLQDI